MSMMAFRLCFFFFIFAFLFSCEGRDEKTTSSLGGAKRRLFEIKGVRKMIPNNRLQYYDWPNDPFFEVTLKNVSNFDLDLYYHKRNPHRTASCIEYINDPTTAGCAFYVDTSRLIKKGEEFMLFLPLWMSDSKFYKYDLHGITFRVLISSLNDLSANFEHFISDPKYLSIEPDDSRKKYDYPFEFTYWPSTGLFWEHYLLE